MFENEKDGDRKIEERKNRDSKDRDGEERDMKGGVKKNNSVWCFDFIWILGSIELLKFVIKGFIYNKGIEKFKSLKIWKYVFLL